MQDSDNTSTRPNSAHTLSRAIHSVAIFMIVALILINSFQPAARAAQLFNRSVVSSTSLPGQVSTQIFSFTIQSSTSVGSIAFLYCENSPIFALLCDPPPGLDMTTSVLSGQTGETGFTDHPNTTTTKKVVSRAAAVTTPGQSTYTLSNVTNPTTSGAVYIRISTFASSDGTGVPTDTGAVIYSTNFPLTVQVYVPPFLILCAGVTVTIDCQGSNGFGVNLGELSKTDANTATTQFAVATNSFTGYTASIQGTTMTAGNRTIPQLIVPAASLPGTGQFGINLTQNSSPAIGSAIEGVGTGSISGAYTVPNNFRFNSGDVVATSTQSTEFNRYTISYLVNVADSQTPGRYAATITVIATTTF